MHLFLLFCHRRGIRQLGDRLPLLVFLKPFSDGPEKADNRVRHRSLEIVWMHVTFLRLEHVPECVIRGEVH